MATGDNIDQDIREFPTLGKIENGLAFKEVPNKVTTVGPGKISNTEIIDLLECPVCLHTMLYPPIHQCSNGHTICFKCKSRVNNTCPICRKELGNIRCIALEKVADLLELPCKFSVYGCQAMYRCKNRARHEQSCRFGLYNCPYPGAECQVTGNVGTLVTHLKEDHGVNVHNVSKFNQKHVQANPNEFKTAFWTSTIFNCFGHHFYLHFESFEIKDAPVYIAIMRFMGEETDAKKFGYGLDVVNGDGRRMMWQGVPRSIRDSHKTVCDGLDGLIVPRNRIGGQQELELLLAGEILR